MAELSREDLHELYGRFDDEVYNKGNIDAIDELVTDGFRHHDPFPTRRAGRDSSSSSRGSGGLPRCHFHNRDRGRRG